MSITYGDCDTLLWSQLLERDTPMFASRLHGDPSVSHFQECGTSETTAFRGQASAPNDYAALTFVAPPHSRSAVAPQKRQQMNRSSGRAGRYRSKSGDCAELTRMSRTSSTRSKISLNKPAFSPISGKLAADPPRPSMTTALSRPSRRTTRVGMGVWRGHRRCIALSQAPRTAMALRSHLSRRHRCSAQRGYRRQRLT